MGWADYAEQQAKRLDKLPLWKRVVIVISLFVAAAPLFWLIFAS